jgi:hypothetical protein
MNKKIKSFIVWILLFHAAFAFGFFLVIPLVKAVYIGEEFFWFQYPLWRITTIIVYLGMTVLSVLFASLESQKY